jgi:hypothetical protein
VTENHTGKNIAYIDPRDSARCTECGRWKPRECPVIAKVSTRKKVYQVAARLFSSPEVVTDRQLSDYNDTLSRMLKKAVQRGRSERRGESYSLPYVEPLSGARTKLADFFSILL